MNECVSGLKSEYRTIFIVDSLSVWENQALEYCSETDLVLTFDVALRKVIEGKGGDAFFVDHLVSNEIMQRNNHLSYKFFDTWHLDSGGKDIFTYKNVDFGRAFQLEYWNDFTYYIRLYLSISVVKNIVRAQLKVLTTDEVLCTVLSEQELVSGNIIATGVSDNSGFYFPIEQWMNEKIRPSAFRGLLYKARSLLNLLIGNLMILWDRARNNNKKTVFVQEYHPTKEILKNLRKDDGIKLLLSNFSRGSKFKDHFAERVLPIELNPQVFVSQSDELLNTFKQKKCQRLILDDGSDVTESVYRVIELRVSACLSNYLSTLDSCISYLDKNTVDFEVMISNIGTLVTLFDCACESKNVPSYLIINGLLGPAYSTESKRATVINAYSESIKQYYFRGMNNVVALGDPRMDSYSESGPRNNINRDLPTIVIGAAGFNNVDLNSYVAFEFDFLFDILTALTIVKKQNKINVIIKTRPNGYKWQYINFVDKYFNGMVDQIIDDQPMVDVLRKADFYISIYSQTLFEASCLGVPVVYYRKDNEIMDPPFDGKSELVTVSSVDGLVQAFDDFKCKHKRFDDFLNREIMERYVGPLDGNNLKRNLDFILHLVKNSR